MPDKDSALAWWSASITVFPVSSTVSGATFSRSRLALARAVGAKWRSETALAIRRS